MIFQKLTPKELFKLLEAQGLIELDYMHGLYTVTPKGKIFVQPPSLSFEDVVVVPKFNSVKSRSDVDLTTELARGMSIPTPMIAANMQCVTGGSFVAELWKHGIVGALHRFYKDNDSFLSDVKLVANSGAPVIISCGVFFDETLIASAIDLGAQACIVDIAHGHSQVMVDAAKKLRKLFPSLKLILGNICTPEAVVDLEPWADAVKVGISNGSVCQTQLKTGAGLGQITSVLECAAEAKKHGLPVICDGGISEPSDVVKALVAGANTCMAGKVFARCPESPAEPVYENGEWYKKYYGMASNGLKKQNHSEGIVSLVRLGASAADFTKEFFGGVRSGYTYCGASNLSELWERGELRLTTKASYEKGLPYAGQKISN
jgi:IMP dehydrogenase